MNAKQIRKSKIILLRLLQGLKSNCHLFLVIFALGGKRRGQIPSKHNLISQRAKNVQYRVQNNEIASAKKIRQIKMNKCYGISRKILTFIGNDKRKRLI